MATRYLQKHKNNLIKVVLCLVVLVILFLSFDSIILNYSNSLEEIQNNSSVKVMFFLGALLPSIAMMIGIQGAMSIIKTKSLKNKNRRPKSLVQAKLNRVGDALNACVKKLELNQEDFNKQIDAADKKITFLKQVDPRFERSKNTAAQQVIGLKGVYKKNILYVQKTLEQSILDINEAAATFERSPDFAKESLKNFKKPPV